LVELDLIHFFCTNVREVVTLDVTPGGGALSTGALGTVGTSGGGFGSIASPSTLGGPSATSAKSTSTPLVVTVTASSFKAGAVPTQVAGIVEVMAAAGMAVLNFL
jgi:hypothetical protein